jgi:uncharacterized protein YdeI (YjbR/CyaY-like superfamily)
VGEHERLEVETREQWRGWLAEHHAGATGVWVVTFKQGAGRPRVSYDALVEEALAFGWVDSRSKGLDEHRTQLLVTPRRPGSRWSGSNKTRVARLVAEGRMAPAGLEAVERAKADGSWTALDAVEALEEPDDLRAGLDGEPAARAHWEGFPPGARRAILEWIVTARRPETRARRIAETVREAGHGRRANERPARSAAPPEPPA